MTLWEVGAGIGAAGVFYLVLAALAPSWWRLAVGGALLALGIFVSVGGA